MLRELGLAVRAALDNDALYWRRRLIDVVAELTINSFCTMLRTESGSCNLVSALLSAGLISIVLLLMLVMVFDFFYYRHQSKQTIHWLVELFFRPLDSSLVNSSDEVWRFLSLH